MSETAVQQDDHAATVEAVIDALEPLGFEQNVIDWSGGEPCTSLDLGDGRCLDVTVTLAAVCDCCDLDEGQLIHVHSRCSHPCCPEQWDDDAPSERAGA